MTIWTTGSHRSAPEPREQRARQVAEPLPQTRTIAVLDGDVARQDRYPAVTAIGPAPTAAATRPFQRKVPPLRGAAQLRYWHRSPLWVESEEQHRTGRRRSADVCFPPGAVMPPPRQANKDTIGPPGRGVDSCEGLAASAT